MNHFHVPKLEGVDKDSHPREIPDNRCSDLENVWFKYGKVARRGGYTNMATLRGAVTGYDYFELMYSSDTYPLSFTTSDVYYYDYEQDQWMFLTPTYTDGAVTCGGDTTVTLTPIDGVSQVGGLAVSAVAAEEFKTTQESVYYIGGVECTKAATDGLSFTSTGTINTAAEAGQYWGIWLVQITSTGVISTKSPSADQVYTTSTLAIADKPDPDTDNVELGYILVRSNSGATWTANADDLTAGSDCASCSFVDVTLSGVVWDTSWPAGGQYEIGFGTTNKNLVTTWYTIQAMITGTELLLLSNGPTVSSSEYVIRKCFSGSYSSIPNIFDYTTVIDPLTNDSMILFANYAEPIYYFSGATSTGILSGPEYTAMYLSYYHNHTIAAYIKDNTTLAQYPQSVMYSVVGDPRDWTGTGSGITQLSADPSIITGMTIFKEHLYIFKQLSITTVQYTSNATTPFDFLENTAVVGTAVGRTIGVTDNYMIYLGPDGIYAFDGLSAQRIGQGITKFLFDNLNYEYLETSHAVIMRDHNLYVLFVPLGDATAPNYAFAFDYTQNIWTIWTFADVISGTGKLARTQFFTSWINATGTWEEQEGTWGGRNLSAGAPYTVFGDTSGQLHKFDGSDTDNGTAITAFLTTSDCDCDNTKAAKRFNEFIIAHEIDATTSVHIDCSIDYGNSWSPDQIYLLNGTQDMTETVVNTMEHGKQVRYRIRNIDGNDFAFEGFTVGFVPVGITVPR